MRPYYDPNYWRDENDMPINKPILVLDFDGVIHSYTTEWQGTDVIPDPPVPGAFKRMHEYIEHFTVYIVSARSATEDGVKAMKEYIDYWDRQYWLTKLTYHTPLKNHLHFPLVKKQPAHVTIDDRGYPGGFEGDWDNEKYDVESIKNFKPWNKR